MFARRTEKRGPKTVIKNTDHPAAHRKIRCTFCNGYAVGTAHSDKQFTCHRCGRTFVISKL